MHFEECIYNFLLSKIENRSNFSQFYYWKYKILIAMLKWFQTSYLKIEIWNTNFISYEVIYFNIFYLGYNYVLNFYLSYKYKIDSYCPPTNRKWDHQAVSVYLCIGGGDIIFPC